MDTFSKEKLEATMRESQRKRRSRKWHKQRDSACEKFFLEQDDFKTPIQVSYNQEGFLNTAYGGFMSIMLKLSILIYGIQKTYNCYQRT